MAIVTRASLRSRARALVGSRRVRVAARLAAGASILAVLGARVGTGPFIRGLMGLDVRSVVIALTLGMVATASMSWRWRVIAVRLGVGFDWPTAFALYYGSQFLNTVLPGGVLGDADRAVAHGRRSASTADSARSVVLDRASGQLVQLVVSVAVLAGFGLEFEGYVLGVAGVALGAVLCLAFAGRTASTRIRAILGQEYGRIRAGMGSPAALAQVVGTSMVAIACQIALFCFAATAVGVDLPPSRLAALALVVLLAASIPLNVGGWGPREGAAGWAFALAGAGVASGVAAATLFGVLTMIAVSPGAVSPGAGAHFVIERNHREPTTVRHVERGYVARRVS